MFLNKRNSKKISPTEGGMRKELKEAGKNSSYIYLCVLSQ
jgi:hypothetical protein